MKNNNKKFILIPLLSSLVILLSACSIIVSDHNDSKPEIRTTISNQGFNKLAVSVAISDISVKYGDKYKVEYAGPKNLKPIVNRKNGVLTIKQSASGVHHVNSDLTIAITVPKQLLKNVTLSTNDGDIEVENIATTNSISVATNDGDININKLISKNGFKVNTDDGDIKVSNSSFTGYRLDTSDGDIKVKDSSSSSTFIENKNSSNVLIASTQDGDIKIK